MSIVTTDYEVKDETIDKTIGQLGTNLGNGFWLVSLFSIVGCDALGLDTLGLCVVLFVVISEEIDFVIVLLLSLCSRSSRSRGS